MSVDRDRLRHQLISDEGLRLKPYKDTVGKLTIGCGRNLDDIGISEQEAMFLLDNDINRCVHQLVVRYAQWFPKLDPVRQAVLANMLFNLGILNFMGFKKMLASVEAKDYEGAAVEMLASLWSEQVGNRALLLAEQMRRGVWVDR